MLCVGGVNTQRDRVGYSSQGPGRLSRRTPDICAFTHFSGSEAFGPGAPDSGTSAACPVAAGVVAAIRTQWSAASIGPGELRTLLRRTADDRGAAGFDYGYGVVNVPRASWTPCTAARRTAAPAAADAPRRDMAPDRPSLLITIELPSGVTPTAGVRG
ncbi:hypothetical protein ABB07_33050 [Streptomyces incarnatus]|uniref:Peptidase S8/S53 domain-containing protein n=1 Tax=Streptomyces incarnatus TaxID=665007 RepID=A0ABN4GS26_9ACTN|nr:S8 family serine peptidase [Streptomyces incarnatus]AKJ14714.1 hypothetical protein ABB07_33050 [Streptomyces incarnatus]